MGELSGVKWLMVSVQFSQMHCRILERAAVTKKLSRNTGEKMKGRPPNLNKNSKLVNKKTSPKTKGVTKKVGRPKLEDQNSEKGASLGGVKADLAGRRVSTRSKKPDDGAPGPNSKRR